MFSTLVLYLPFVIVIFMSHTTPSLGLLAATHLLVTHVGPCGDASGLLITFDELVITTQTVDCSLAGVFNLTEDIANGWKVKVRTAIHQYRHYIMNLSITTLTITSYCKGRTTT